MEISINTQISGSIFWGFKTKTVLEKQIIESKTVEEIHELLINDALKRLELFTKKHNLLALQDKIKDMRYHIHSHLSIVDIKKAIEKDQTIYICDCDKKEGK